MALALGERFDRVNVYDQSIEARASGLIALFMRGPRTHPMLPFDRVRIELVDGEPQRMAYALSTKMQVAVYSYLAVAAGLLASIDRGLIKGLSMGFLLAAAVFFLNFLISRHRAPKWLSTKWQEALSLTGSQTAAPAD